MASIKSQITLNDGMSSILRQINSALLVCIDSFESMQRVSEKSIDVSVLNQARSSLISVSSQLETINNGQKGVNQSIREGTSEADSFLRKLAGIAATYLSIKTAANFVKSALKEAAEGFSIDAQLTVSLKNAGLGKEAMNQLKEAASQYGMYTKSAMTAAAAEFATYLSDARAIESMMSTLADYAAGMSGGVELSTQQLIDYATQLGKVLNGQFDGIAKKGFEVSEIQKEILENGTELERVAVVADIINESWAGMYETMANTPQGQIIAMNNEIAQLKENMGAGLLPVVMQFVMAIKENMPTIQALFTNFGKIVATIIPILAGLLDFSLLVASAIIDNWSWISPVVYGIVGAFIAWKIATINVTASFAALNATLMANPFILIIGLIVAIIVVIYQWIESVGGLQNAWEICKASLIVGWKALIVAFTWTVATFRNLLNKVKYAFVSAGVAIQTFMINTKVMVLRILELMLNTAIDIINSFIAALNMIPGVSIQPIQHLTFAATAALEAEAKKQAGEEMLARYKLEIESGKARGQAELIAAQHELQESFNDLTNLYSNATKEASNSKAEDIAKSNEDMLSKLLSQNQNIQNNTGGDLGSSGSSGGYSEGEEAIKEPESLKKIQGSSGGTAENTESMAKAMDLAIEEIKYIKDLAEREAINKFTTAEIRIEMTNNNNVSGEADMDMLVAYLTEKVYEASEKIAEGVY